MSLNEMCAEINGASEERVYFLSVLSTFKSYRWFINLYTLKIEDLHLINQNLFIIARVVGFIILILAGLNYLVTDVFTDLNFSVSIHL